MLPLLILLNPKLMKQNPVAAVLLLIITGIGGYALWQWWKGRSQPATEPPAEGSGGCRYEVTVKREEVGTLEFIAMRLLVEKATRAVPMSRPGLDQSNTHFWVFDREQFAEFAETAAARKWQYRSDMICNN